MKKTGQVRFCSGVSSGEGMDTGHQPKRIPFVAKVQSNFSHPNNKLSLRLWPKSHKRTAYSHLQRRELTGHSIPLSKLSRNNRQISHNNSIPSLYVVREVFFWFGSLILWIFQLSPFLLIRPQAKACVYSRFQTRIFPDICFQFCCCLEVGKFES